MAKKISPEISVFTEITASTASPPAPRVPVDPVALAIALVGGPVSVAIVLAWLLIPVAALAFGGPLYVMVGLPILLVYLGRASATSARIAGLALVANTTVCLAAWLAFMGTHDSEIVLMYLCFGTVFAPLWGLVTGWIYFGLRRPIPVPQIKG